MNGTVILKFLAFLTSYRKFYAIFVSPNRYFTENSRWVPLKTVGTFFKKMPGSIERQQGLQILLMSGGTVTSASQILESFWNIWSQVPQRKKPFSDFPARGPGMYTLS